MKIMRYLPRLSDDLLELKLRSTGAVLIEGAKWCGKTTSALRVAKSVVFMQDPVNRQRYVQIVDMMPQELLSGRTPRLIDEWQIAPKLWDAIRFEIDQRQSFGQFILTGSVVPGDLSEILHTGTGRISRMTMRTMSLFESQDSNGSVSLKKLFDGDDEIRGSSDIDLKSLAYLLCRGGWPMTVKQPEEVALMQAKQYVDAIIFSDFPRTDQRDRDPQKLSRFLRSYSRLLGSQAPLKTILDDVSNNEVDISESTIYDYRKNLTRLFVIEEMPSWNPNLRSKTAIRSSETLFFVDPAIGAAALGLGPDDMLTDLKTFGLLFENLCARDLRIYSESLDGTVFHYRDRYGLECDAVIHLRNGKYGLIEVKLGGDQAIEQGAKTLKKLAQKIDTEKMNNPSFMMVITGIGGLAYRRKDGVFVVPIGCLRN